MMEREKVIKAFEFCLMPPNEKEILSDICSHEDCPYYREYNGGKCMSAAVSDALALLKAQEPVKPMLARGWYWCGGVGCRYSLTSALDDDSPARKPNYCEKCGRAVKWDA